MKVQDTDYLEIVRRLNPQKIPANPFLDIAARFWDDKHYDAATVCYQSMRVIDDLVDERKAAGHGMSEAEKLKLTTMVNDWVEAIERAEPCDMAPKELVETRARFQIPIWPWRSFAGSMVYDLSHDGFRTFPVFLRYAEGAAVAPAAIGIHLCTTVKEKGIYRPLRFNIRKAATPLALFFYLVHIIRDFQKDQNNNLNYFADNLLAKSGLNPRILGEIAAGGEIDSGFRRLMGQYYAYAEHYRLKARRMIDRIGNHLRPRYRLSLEIIYALYLLIFERIDVTKGRFTATELIPSPEEIKDRINRTITNADFVGT